LYRVAAAHCENDRRKHRAPDEITRELPPRDGTPGHVLAIGVHVGIRKAGGNNCQQHPEQQGKTPLDPGISEHGCLQRTAAGGWAVGGRLPRRQRHWSTEVCRPMQGSSVLVPFDQGFVPASYIQTGQAAICFAHTISALHLFPFSFSSVEGRPTSCQKSQLRE